VWQVARLNPSELIMLGREENRIDPSINIPVLGGRQCRRIVTEPGTAEACS